MDTDDPRSPGGAEFLDEGGVNPVDVGVAVLRCRGGRTREILERFIDSCPIRGSGQYARNKRFCDARSALECAGRRRFKSYALEQTSAERGVEPAHFSASRMIRDTLDGMKAGGGAYVLRLELRKPARIRVGALGQIEFQPGQYLYVGSARGGIAARVARHKRVIEKKSGVGHWHIDFLLLHPHYRLAGVELLPGAGECRLARSIARRSGVIIPVPGFGSTDCRSGCRAHLFFQTGTRAPDQWSCSTR